MASSTSVSAVVVGGGTGIFPVIAALRQLQAHIATVVAVSDSGGSTGKIRDEFGFQPVGDLRQSLAALAQDGGGEWIRQLLLYRFDKGDGLKGHNLGNLILTALQDMTGDTYHALEIAEKIFRIEGKVIPAANENVQLQIEYVNGTTIIGEHTLDVASPLAGNPIRAVQLIPHATLHPEARQAVTSSDLVIIGPGDYYASLMAALLPEGMVEAMSMARGRIVYVMNLMTRITQTHGMTAADHVAGIERTIGRKLDCILVHSGGMSEEIRLRYAKEHEFPVVDDLGDDPRVIRSDLISPTIQEKTYQDNTHRSLLRHDSGKLQAALSSLL